MTDGPKARTKKFSPQAIHLVRTASQANLALSQMADQKASLLMGAAIVVFTLSIGRADQTEATLPMVVLGISAFISACLAIASVIPSIGAAPVKDDKANVLFFGVFSEMKEEQFADAVIESLSDEEEMFRLMLRDIYQNGQVLRHKKYKLLGWSYRVFLIGLVGSLAAFLWVLF